MAVQETPHRDLTRLFRTLSDETRFRLLRLLWREELSVNELSQITQLAQPRISNHLKILREENLISERRAGSWRHYRVDVDELDETARALWPALQAAWKENAKFAADDKRLSEVLSNRQQGDRFCFFDELADHWDEYRGRLFGDALSREILRAFLPRDLVVADIGTGTGYTLELFGKRAKKLIAVDHSEGMLSLARERAEAADLHNVEFRLVNAAESPLEEGEADVITVIQVLHHMESPGEVVGSLAEGLRPGGLLIVNEFLHHHETWLREELQHRWNGFPREKLIGWLEKTGLDIESWDVLPGRILSSSEGRRLRVPDAQTVVSRKK